MVVLTMMGVSDVRTSVTEASVSGPLLIVIVVALLAVGVLGGYLLRRRRMR